jgi:dUTP pyrophosphatase
MKIKVKFKPTSKLFQLPEKHTKLASGFDLRYCGDAPVWFGTSAGQVEMLDLGFSMELPPGYEAQIRPRSGLAAKYGLTILNSPGTVDSDFRGPVKAILVRGADHSGLGTVEQPWNHFEVFKINPGDRICQMVIQKVPEVELVIDEDLSETERAEGGFGSTGVQ